MESGRFWPHNFKLDATLSQKTKDIDIEVLVLRQQHLKLFQTLEAYKVLSNNVLREIVHSVNLK